MQKSNKSKNNWYKADLHIHSSASSDYQQPEMTFFNIIEQASKKNIDIISITDHNTVAGHRKFREEIENLELLVSLNRALPKEKEKLKQYKSYLNKVLLLPGFEFTATFGFHILCIFSPETTVREMEFLLLRMNIPVDQLDDGSQTVGATTDVQSIYRIVNQAGGIVIAAHANSSNGVAMRGYNFGGQTKIAYTQDSNLHALEVTDLDLTGPRTTAAFFSGTKPEYPRRMICVQGSDAHRLVNDPTRKKNFGVGDRVTEFLLPERSFGALRQLFIDEDPSKVRPLRKKAEQAFDYVQSAINDGSNIIQEFENFSSLRVKNLDTSLAHICGFLNTNGGTLYIGVSSDPTATPTGFGSVEQGKKMLEKSIAERINPPVHCTIDAQSYKGKKILRIVVPQGAEPPYALDDNKIYVRGEAETNLAVRDEIVSLAVRRGKNGSAASDKSDLHATLTPNVNESIIPKTGVEVLTPEDRKGKLFFTVRDLRNGNLVKNVTVQSARKLWQYAINKYTQDIKQLNSSEAHWEGNLSLIRKTNMGNVPRFDLAIRDGETLRLFYGVTAEGIHEDWSKVTGETD